MGLNRLIFAIISGVVVVLVTAFHFYRKEKPFHLRLKKKKQQYNLVNVNISECTVLAELVNGPNTFTFQLTFMNDEIIHFQINDPNYRRYIVEDVVILPPNTKQEITIKQEHKNLLHVYNKSLTITINCDEFLINISQNNKLILCVKSFVIEEKEPCVGISANFVFPKAVRAFGLPQHADRLSLTPNGFYRLFNTDRFAYSTSFPQESLYGAVPVIYAHSPNQSTGVLWLNASESFVEVEQDQMELKSTFFSESGAVDFYIMSGPGLKDCVRQNSQLTGVVPLPPLFALGYHQSRFSYMSQDEILEVSNKFEENELPLDCVWMDVDYTDGKKYFTWNSETYPNPDLMLNFLEKKKRKAVVIIDPHIKVDEKYFVYGQCKKMDLFVKNPDGTIFVAKCWPGLSSWIDFLNPKARHFYADLHVDFAKSRILHIWNDMNEPALFGTKENSMPKILFHYGNWKHRDVHNLYGFYQTKATYEGLLKRPNLRPFILTRSHFAGGQRFAGIWTGDNSASWEHLKISVPMCLTASLAGFSFCGADIGGFVKHPEDELLQRWYQLGVWLPFFRGHSNRNVPRREPYLYNKVVQERIQTCLHQRYMHLLHWYTLFWQHYITLEPVVRPLVYQYPQDEKVTDLDEEFLVGNGILVRPVMEPQTEYFHVYLPGDTEVWYYLGEKYQTGYVKIFVDMDTIPVFYKGGLIVPMVEQKVSSSVFLKDCPITLFIFCDKLGAATGTLYSDDYESFQFLKKCYHHVRVDFENSTIKNFQIHQNASFGNPRVVNAIKLFGYDDNITQIELQIDGCVKSDHEIEILTQDSCTEIKNLGINLQQKFIITLSQ